MPQEVLILIATKCSMKRGTKPVSNREQPTIAMHQYDVLTEMPYQLTYEQLKDEVHGNRRGKELTREQSKTYMMKRSELCKIWGWGVHQDKNGKLALVGCETKEYRRLVKDLQVQKEKALNPSQAQIVAMQNYLEKGKARETVVFQLRLETDMNNWMEEHVNLNHTSKADLIRKLLTEYRAKSEENNEEDESM